MLKNWIIGPLLDPKAINDRLDAIEDLEANSNLRDKFKNELRKLPDLERMCGRIYNYSVKKNTNAHLFEQVGVTRLREFKTLLDGFRTAYKCLSTFQNVEFKSELLQNLMTFDDYKNVMSGQSKYMPDVLPLLNELADFIRWEGEPNKSMPTPKPGVD